MPAIGVKVVPRSGALKKSSARNARYKAPVVLPGCQSEMSPDAGVPALRSVVWRDSEGLPLLGPARRHIHQTRSAEAARQSSINCRLDDVRSKVSEGKSLPAG